MTDQGIAYCSARVDPYAHVQVADFSNIQYLELHHSEEEINDQGTRIDTTSHSFALIRTVAGESEPREHHVDESQFEPPTHRKVSSRKSTEVKPHKARKGKAERSEPQEPTIEKGTILPVSAKKKRDSKKSAAKGKKTNEKADEAKDAVKGMESNAESSEPSLPPAANIPPKDPSPSSEPQKPADSSPPPQSAGQEPAETEKKEVDVDPGLDHEAEAPNGDEESKETKEETTPVVALMNDSTSRSSDGLVVERPSGAAASESAQEPPPEAENTQPPVSSSSEIGAQHIDEQITPEAASEPVQTDSTPPAPSPAEGADKKQPSEQGESPETSQPIEVAQSPPLVELKSEPPIEQSTNSQETPESAPELVLETDTSELEKPQTVADESLNDKAGGEAPIGASSSSEESNVAIEESKNPATKEKANTAGSVSEAATPSDDGEKAEDQSKATDAPAPAKAKPEVESGPEESTSEVPREPASEKEPERVSQGQSADTLVHDSEVSGEEKSSPYRSEASETNEPNDESSDKRAALVTDKAVVPAFQTEEAKDESAGESTESVAQTEEEASQVAQSTDSQSAAEPDQSNNNLSADIPAHGGDNANDLAAELPGTTSKDNSLEDDQKTQDKPAPSSSAQEKQSSAEFDIITGAETNETTDESRPSVEAHKGTTETEESASPQESGPPFSKQADLVEATAAVEVLTTGDICGTPADDIPTDGVSECPAKIENAPDPQEESDGIGDVAEDGADTTEEIELAMDESAGKVAGDSASACADSPAPDAPESSGDNQKPSDENAADSPPLSEVTPKNTQGTSVEAPDIVGLQTVIEVSEHPSSTDSDDKTAASHEGVSTDSKEEEAETKTSVVSESPKGETDNSEAALSTEPAEPTVTESGAQQGPVDGLPKPADGDVAADLPEQTSTSEEITKTKEAKGTGDRPGTSSHEAESSSKFAEDTVEAVGAEVTPVAASSESSSTNQRGADNTEPKPQEQVQAEPASREGQAASQKPASLEQKAPIGEAVEDPAPAEESAPIEKSASSEESTPGDSAPTKEPAPTEEPVTVKERVLSKEPALTEESASSVEQTPGESVSAEKPTSSGDPAPIREPSPIEESASTVPSEPDVQENNTAVSVTDDSSVPQPAEPNHSVEESDSAEFSKDEVPPEEVVDGQSPEKTESIDAPANSSTEPQDVDVSRDAPAEEVSAVEKHDDVPENQGNPAISEMNLIVQDAAPSLTTEADKSIDDQTQAGGEVAATNASEETISEETKEADKTAEEPATEAPKEGPTTEPAVGESAEEPTAAEQPDIKEIPTERTPSEKISIEETVPAQQPLTKEVPTKAPAQEPLEHATEQAIAEEAPPENAPTEKESVGEPAADVSAQEAVSVKETPVEISAQESTEDPVEQHITGRIAEDSVAQDLTAGSAAEVQSKEAPDAEIQTEEVTAGEPTKESAAEESTSIEPTVGNAEEISNSEAPSGESSAEQPITEPTTEQSLARTVTERPLTKELVKDATIEESAEKSPIEEILVEEPAAENTTIKEVPAIETTAKPTEESAEKPAEKAPAKPIVESITESVKETSVPETTAEEISGFADGASTEEPTVEAAESAATEPVTPETESTAEKPIVRASITEEPATKKPVESTPAEDPTEQPAGKEVSAEEPTINEVPPFEPTTETSKEYPIAEPVAEPVEEVGSTEPVIESTSEPAETASGSETAPGGTIEHIIEPTSKECATEVPTTEEPATEALKEPAAAEFVAEKPAELKPEEPAEFTTEETSVKEPAVGDAPSATLSPEPAAEPAAEPTTSIEPTTKPTEESISEEVAAQAIEEVSAEPTAEPPSEESVAQLEETPAPETIISNTTAPAIEVPIAGESPIEKHAAEAAAPLTAEPAVEIIASDVPAEEPVSEPVKELRAEQPVFEELVPAKDSTAEEIAKKTTPEPVSVASESGVPQEETQHEVSSKEDRNTTKEVNTEPPVGTTAPDQPQGETKGVTDGVTAEVAVKNLVESPATNNQTGYEKTPEAKAKLTNDKVKREEARDDDESKDTIGPIPSQDRLARKASKGEDESFLSSFEDTPSVIANDFGDTPESVPERLFSIEDGGDDLKNDEQNVTGARKSTQSGECFNITKASHETSEINIQLQGEAAAGSHLHKLSIDDDFKTVDGEQAPADSTNTLSEQDWDVQHSSTSHTEALKGPDTITPESEDLGSKSAGNLRPELDSGVKDPSAPAKASVEHLLVYEPRAEFANEEDATPETIKLEPEHVQVHKPNMINAKVFSPEGQDESGGNPLDSVGNTLGEIPYESSITETAIAADPIAIPVDDEKIEPIETVEQATSEFKIGSIDPGILTPPEDPASVVVNSEAEPTIKADDIPGSLSIARNTDNDDTAKPRDSLEEFITSEEEQPTKLTSESPQPAIETLSSMSASEGHHGLIDEDPADPVARESPYQIEDVQQATGTSKPGIPDVSSIFSSLPDGTEKLPELKAELTPESESLVTRHEIPSGSLVKTDVQESTESVLNMDLHEANIAFPPASNVRATVEDPRGDTITKEESLATIEHQATPEEVFNLKESINESIGKIHESEIIPALNNEAVFSITDSTEDESRKVEIHADEATSIYQPSNHQGVELKITTDKKPQSEDQKENVQSNPLPTVEVNEVENTRSVEATASQLQAATPSIEEEPHDAEKPIPKDNILYEETEHDSVNSIPNAEVEPEPILQLKRELERESSLEIGHELALDVQPDLRPTILPGEGDNSHSESQAISYETFETHDTPQAESSAEIVVSEAELDIIKDSSKAESHVSIEQSATAQGPTLLDEPIPTETPSQAKPSIEGDHSVPTENPATTEDPSAQELAAQDTIPVVAEQAVILEDDSSTPKELYGPVEPALQGETSITVAEGAVTSEPAEKEATALPEDPVADDPADPENAATSQDTFAKLESTLIKESRSATRTISESDSAFLPLVIDGDPTALSLKAINLPTEEPASVPDLTLSHDELAISAEVTPVERSRSSIQDQLVTPAGPLPEPEAVYVQGVQEDEKLDTTSPSAIEYQAPLEESVSAEETAMRTYDEPVSEPNTTIGDVSQSVAADSPLEGSLKHPLTQPSEFSVGQASTRSVADTSEQPTLEPVTELAHEPIQDVKSSDLPASDEIKPLQPQATEPEDSPVVETLIAAEQEPVITEEEPPVTKTEPISSEYQGTPEPSTADSESKEINVTSSADEEAYDTLRSVPPQDEISTAERGASDLFLESNTSVAKPPNVEERSDDEQPIIVERPQDSEGSGQLSTLESEVSTAQSSDTLLAKSPGADDDFVFIGKLEGNSVIQPTGDLEWREPAEHGEPSTEVLDDSIEEPAPPTVLPHVYKNAEKGNVKSHELSALVSVIHEPQASEHDDSVVHPEDAQETIPISPLADTSIDSLATEPIKDSIPVLVETGKTEYKLVPIADVASDNEARHSDTTEIVGEVTGEATQSMPENEALSAIFTKDSPPKSEVAPLVEFSETDQVSESKELWLEQKSENAEALWEKPAEPTDTPPKEQSNVSETKGEGDRADANASGIVEATEIVVASEVLVDEAPVEIYTPIAEHPFETTHSLVEKLDEPESSVISARSKSAHGESTREPYTIYVRPTDRSIEPLLGDRDDTDSFEKEVISDKPIPLPEPSKSMDFINIDSAGPKDATNPSVKESASRPATPESPEIIASNMPLSESFTIVEKERIPQKSSKRTLRSSLVHSGTQTEDFYDFIPSPGASLYSIINFPDLEPRSTTPAIVLPDLTDSKARALGRARSVRKQRRHTVKHAEETVAAAVVIYAAVQELNPPPTSEAGSPQADNNREEALEPTQEVIQKSDVISPGDSVEDRGISPSDVNDVLLPVADLLTDDEDKKPAEEAKSSDRHHRHRHHHHRHHHHSSNSRDSKSSVEHHRSSRGESNLSVWTASDHSGSRLSKGRDSGFSLESPRTSSSRKHRTPEEQAAHDRRKEERRAAREALKERESKGKEPETPLGDRHSHRSSRRHSLSYSERSHSEKLSLKEDTPTQNKSFDIKNGESALAPNYVPRPRTSSTNDSYSASKESPTSGSLNRSSTAKSHGVSADISGSKSRRESHRETYRENYRENYRDRGEPDRRRREEPRHATQAEASTSKAPPVAKDEYRSQSKREERQKAREAEAKKKSTTGFRAAIKKLFS
ncbi:hypothetical protein AAE478_006456 [Parahypoxylon ruwenzoriense]